MVVSLADYRFAKYRHFIPAGISPINQMLKNSSKTAEGSEGMDE